MQGDQLGGSGETVSDWDRVMAGMMENKGKLKDMFWKNN